VCCEQLDSGHSLHEFATPEKISLRADTLLYGIYHAKPFCQLVSIPVPGTVLHNKMFEGNKISPNTTGCNLCKNLLNLKHFNLLQIWVRINLNGWICIKNECRTESVLNECGYEMLISIQDHEDIPAQYWYR
jgi:hypothetical protein